MFLDEPADKRPHHERPLLGEPVDERLRHRHGVFPICGNVHMVPRSDGCPPPSTSPRVACAPHSRW